MTKLEWCKQNAPEAIQELPDVELVELMESSWKRFSESANTDEEFESVEYEKNDINTQLDYMVLELSREFGDKLAFKGGYMLTKLMSGYARQTTDIDFSILTDEIYTEIKRKLLKIAKHFADDGIIDSFTLKETIQPTMSGGIDFYKDGKKILGVDVGWHDVTYGTKKIKLDVGEVTAFEVERMLADKITAILSRKRFRRPKDIYDLFCITECFDLDTKKVKEYILRRTDGADADWQNFPFNEDVIREYKRAYEKLVLNSIYKDVNLSKPDFNVVMERFNTIALSVQKPERYPTSIWNCSTKSFNFK